MFYHGSPEKFDTPKAGQFFLAKEADYSRRYGAHLYEVEFDGEPQFETPTILVIDAAQITRIKLIETRENAVIYGK